METGIKVEGPQPVAVDAVVSGIIAILQTGFDTHADQSTIQHAITNLAAVFKGPITISGCEVKSISN